MLQTYPVQFNLKPSWQSHATADGETVDLQAHLDNLPGLLPPGAYIKYVEDLTAGRNVQSTRWLNVYHSGFGG